MTTNAYEALLISNVWDDRFDLPSVRQHLNPHIYTAYAVRVLESFDDLSGKNPNWEGALTIRDHYAKTFLKNCETESGLITTYPGGGTSSHDDAQGASFLNQAFAARCVLRLSEHEGTYTTGPETESKNVYRFLFFLPSVRAFARFRVGILSQVLFILALLGNLYFTKEGSTDGHLLLWVAFPEMRKKPLVAAFIDYWADKWTKRGYTPKTIFNKYYLVECPWFGEWARSDWK